LLNLRNFGQKSRLEVEETLASLGVSFPKMSGGVAADENEKEEEPKKPARKKKAS